jgi:hypothetical protein
MTINKVNSENQMILTKNIDCYVICNDCNFYYDIMNNSPKQNCCFKCYNVNPIYLSNLP